MKANELRIGNYVLLTKDNFYTSKIYQLDGFDIYKLDESNCFDAKPIPITEEWLLKFGFEKNSIDLFYSLKNFIIRHDFILCDIDIRVEIKYVHQLQNLYFLLTGKELQHEQN